MPIKRLCLALIAAIALGSLGYSTLVDFYTSHPDRISVGDGQGRGPDNGSGEWQSAFDQILRSRSQSGGVAIGLLAFVTVLSLFRLSQDKFA